MFRASPTSPPEVTDAHQVLPPGRRGGARLRDGCPRRRRQGECPLLVPRPADGDAHERRRLDQRAGWKQACTARDARPARDADVRLRPEHRVPQVVERHPDGRPARRARRGRPRLGPRPRGARGRPGGDRAAAGRYRRRPRPAALQAGEAAVPFPRTADVGRLFDRNRACHRWQRTRAAAADRLARRPVVHVRRRHDLPALAGEGPDGHRRIEAPGRRPDRRPDPRTEGRFARRRRGDAGKPHRRSRAAAGEVAVNGPQPGCDCARSRVTGLLYERLTRRNRKGGEDRNVNRRRFMWLAVALFALNTFFWVAQGGFALPRGIIDQFFGNGLIRAEVLLKAPTGVQDWRIDRGVVTAVAGTNVTPREADGTIVTL